jgi:hypothetical protein
MKDPEPVGDSGDRASGGVRSPVEDTPFKPCLARCCKCRLSGVGRAVEGVSGKRSWLDMRPERREGEIGEEMPDPSCRGGIVNGARLVDTEEMECLEDD